MRRESGEKGQQVAPALDGVDLVDDEEERRAARGDQVEGAPVVVVPDHRLHQEEDDVDVVQRGRGGPVQHLVELAPAVDVNAGGIDEDDLPLPLRLDAEDAVAGRLGLVGGDAELLPDQPVQERRLADVRATGDRHDSASGHVRLLCLGTSFGNGTRETRHGDVDSPTPARDAGR